MIVIWTQGAEEDLDDIFAYLTRNPGNAARRITERIFEAAQSLSTFPFRDRLLNGTEPRELVVSSSPYIVRYTVEGERVIIVSVRHGAQQLIH